MAEEQTEWQKREMGALWLVEGKNQSFYSGTVKVDGKPIKVVIFKNTKKEEGSNQPDLRIYESKED